MRCIYHDRDGEQQVEVRLDGEVIKSVDGFKVPWVNNNSGRQRGEGGGKKDTGGMEELEGGVRSAM